MVFVDAISVLFQNSKYVERGREKEDCKMLLFLCTKHRYSLKLSNVLLAESFIRLLHFDMALYCEAFDELFVNTSSSSLVLLLLLGFETIDGDFEYGMFCVIQ